MKMKYIVWHDDDLQFVRDGEIDVYTLLPWTAKRFDTEDEADEFMSTHFPCCSFTVLAIKD